MAAIKPGTTNQINKQEALSYCPVTFTLDKIGGRWKPLIIYNLLNGKRRYNELKKAIPAITEKMLIQHLRQMEADQIVKRKVMPVVPPHVEYSLTKKGEALRPMLKEMVEWAELNNYTKHRINAGRMAGSGNSGE
jgi:DNA-binding HxlR family transcriptional regulator